MLIVFVSYIIKVNNSLLFMFLFDRIIILLLLRCSNYLVNIFIEGY